MPQRFTIPPAIAELGFTIEVPNGFLHVETPQEDVDFDNPTQSAPLALFSSPVALALIAVAARPAYATGSVLQWTKYLCDFFGIQVESHKSGATAGAHAHPAIIAHGEQEQNGQQLRMAIVAFEDGGRLITVHAMCPAELWPSYGAELTAAVQSVSLTVPKGPVFDLDSMTAEGWTKITPQQKSKAYEKHMRELESKRRPAEEAAALLLGQGKYEEAEQAIQRVDSSIYGSAVLARLYEETLKSAVKQGAARSGHVDVEVLFQRALSWAQNCYPEAHTSCEAEQYERGRSEDRSRLVEILGHDRAV